MELALASPPSALRFHGHRARAFHAMKVTQTKACALSLRPTFREGESDGSLTVHGGGPMESDYSLWPGSSL